MPFSYSSALAERAVELAQEAGKALLKFISPNDLGITGSHQCGYYLPKAVWQHFTTQAPVDGVNHTHEVTIVWPDGRETESCVKWYGKGTRSEYRITRFGRDFPYLISDMVGDLLVLIPHSLTRFSAFTFDLEEDIESIQAALGIEVVKAWNQRVSWGFYDRDESKEEETEDECLERRFREFAKAVSTMPTGQAFSDATVNALRECMSGFEAFPPDRALVNLFETEYRLFRLIERQVWTPEITRLFSDVDDFITTAKRILNSRASRAGRSFENHASFVFAREGVPHDMRVARVKGVPDVLIPGFSAYSDPSFPVEKLFAVGLKTSCKDRWRQVLNEASRVETKYLLTLQEGVSSNQIDEMVSNNVVLVVPKDRHSRYPKEKRSAILSVEQFLARVKETLS